MNAPVKSARCGGAPLAGTYSSGETMSATGTTVVLAKARTTVKVGFRQDDSGERTSALHERLLDHEMAGGVAVAFEEAAALEHLLQLFQHGGAAAHHDAVGGYVER